MIYFKDYVKIMKENKEMKTITLLIKTEVLEEAAEILEDLGLDINTAINIFIKQIIKRNGIPFEIKNPKNE